MICKISKINNPRCICENAYSPCWDAHRTWTKSERERIVAERKTVCEKCEHKPKISDSPKIEPLSNPERLELPRNPLQFEPSKPISETPVTPEEVERIAERMKFCIGCEKANYTKVEPQPEAAAFIPRTLRLAFTRAEYIHGVQGLTCSDRPGCCALSKAMKEGECERWNVQ